jgi:hypothetical protein
MPPPSLLYETLLNLLQHAPWRDRRHLLTLAWMVMGLLSSGWIALSEWTPFVVGRAHGGLACSPSLQTERGVIPPDEPGLWPAGVAAVAGGSALLPLVSVTGARRPVHLAVGWEKGAQEPWLIVSDEPTDAETLYE